METRININGVTYGEDQLISVNAESIVMGDECPACGNACAATITVDMLVPEEYIPQNAKMILQVRDTGGSWVNKGVYWIDTRSKTRNASNQAITLHLEGFDSMIRAERDYTIPGGEWINLTDAQLLTQICQDSGIESAWTPDKGYTISSAPEDLNGRQLIGYLAGMYGGNAVINGDGKLQLVPLSNGSNKATLTIAESMTIGDQMPPFTAVTVHDMLGGKYTATAAINTGTMMNIDCPWATQAMANDILSRIYGFVYQPYELQNVVIPASVETGDTITFHDLTAKIYTLSLSYGRELVATIGAPDRNECVHDYQSPAAAGGSGGGGGGGAGKARTDSEKLRFAKQQLTADIGDVQSGLYAVASADDIEGLKTGGTTLYAKILDEDDAASVMSKVNLKVTQSQKKDANGNPVYDSEGKPVYMQTADAVMQASVGNAVATVETKAWADDQGHTKTLAQLTADAIYLDGKTTVLGSMSIEDGSLNVDKSVISQNSITGKSIYANGTGTQGIVSGKRGSFTEIAINGVTYAPTTITSTGGPVTVLAC